MSAHGYRVHGFSDARAAIDFYQKNWREITSVVLDMVMPGMNGSAAFDALRAVNPAAPILVCSGYSRHNDMQNILDRDPCGFIQKPFTPQDLVVALNRIGAAPAPSNQ